MASIIRVAFALLLNVIVSWFQQPDPYLEYGGVLGAAYGWIHGLCIGGHYLLHAVDAEHLTRAPEGGLAYLIGYGVGAVAFVGILAMNVSGKKLDLD